MGQEVSIPPPADIRARLAENAKERRALRSLLKLSIQVTEDRVDLRLPSRGSRDVGREVPAR